MIKLEIPAGDFEGYVFDLDGTLIDSMPIHYLAWNETMRRHGLKETLDEDFFYSLGGIPTPLVAERIAEHYGFRVDGKSVEKEKEQAYLDKLFMVKTIPPVVEFARERSKSHPVSIATGGSLKIVQIALQATGLEDIFKIIVTPADVAPGRGKPAPDMFLLAAKKMNVASERCMAFEDAIPGMTAAKAAGMTVVRVPSRS